MNENNESNNSELKNLSQQKRSNIASEFLIFLKTNKKWWLLPIILILLLLTIAAFFGSGPLMPFIYPLM